MKKEDFLVSIIVPIYGTEEYLPACIESLCKQTYKNIQIVLVDDQSPDRCPEICDDYARKDSRIIVIHQKNKGVSGARNMGMRHAKGTYFMFVDSDDELFPNAVEMLLQDAIAHKADIASATAILVYDQGRVVGNNSDGTCSIYRDDQPFLLSLAGDINAGSACIKLFRTDFFQGIQFVEGKNINEDGFFIFQCYMRRPVLVQRNEPVYRCNIRENSNSRSPFSDKYLAMLYFCDRKKALIAAHYPQYTEQAYNMEVRTNLQLLDVLIRTTEKKYKELQRQCVNTVCRLYRYHRPVNNHHKKLAWIVRYGCYPLYKRMVRMKYYK